MKYAEELSAGDFFILNDKVFLLTSDFKKDGSRLGISCLNGSPNWINSQAIVSVLEPLVLDKDNNLISIKNSQNVVD